MVPEDAVHRDHILAPEVLVEDFTSDLAQDRHVKSMLSLY